MSSIEISDKEAALCQNALELYKQEWGWSEDINWTEVNELIAKLDGAKTDE